MLEIKDFNLHFQEQTIFNSASLVLDGPGLYALVADNGIGKTLFFKSLVGLVKGASFSISLNENSDIETRKAITYVPNDKALFEQLTLQENLLLVSEDKEKINQYLHFFHLEDRIHTKCRKLSAGEYQCTSIIQAVLENQPILLLDEPLSHTDYETSQLILQFIKEISLDRYVLFSTHKMDQSDYIESIITINDYQFSKEDKMEIGIRKNCESDVKINSHIANKIIFWLPNLVLTLIMAFLISVLCISFTFLSYSKEKLILNHLQKSSQYLYVMDTYYSDSPSWNRPLPIPKDPVTFDSNYKAVVLQSFLNPSAFDYPITGTEDDFVFMNSDFANTFILVEEYENVKLEDDEIIISKYLYRDFLDFHLIQNSRNPTIQIYGQTYQIKSIIDTPIYDFEKEPSKFYSYLNYVYYKWYMNENTYAAIHAGYNAYCKALSFGTSQFSNPVYLDTNLSSLIYGTQPIDNDEVVVSTSYLEKMNISLSKLQKDKTYGFYILGRDKNGNEITFSKEYKITGVVSSPEIEIFFSNEESMNDFFSNGYHSKEVYAYNPLELSIKDIKEVNSKGLFFSTENNMEIQSIKNNYATLSNNIMLMCVCSGILWIFFYAISTYIYINRKKADFQKLNLIFPVRHIFKRKLLFTAIFNCALAIIFFGLSFSLGFMNFLNLYAQSFLNLQYAPIKTNWIILMLSILSLIGTIGIKYKVVFVRI